MLEETGKCENLDFPNLPPLNDIEVWRIQMYLKADKGLAYDGLSDRWIKYTKKTEMLSNLWNK